MKKMFIFPLLSIFLISGICDNGADDPEEVYTPTLNVYPGPDIYPDATTLYMTTDYQGASIWYSYNGIQPEENNTTTSIFYNPNDSSTNPLVGWGNTVVTAKSFLNGNEMEEFHGTYTVLAWVMGGENGLMEKSEYSGSYWNNTYYNGSMFFNYIATDGQALWYATVAGSNTIYFSENGGDTWTQSFSDSTYNTMFSAVAMFNKQYEGLSFDVAVAVGRVSGDDGSIFYTADRGIVWQHASAPWYLIDVGARNSDTISERRAVAVGQENTIVYADYSNLAVWSQATVNGTGGLIHCFEGVAHVYGDTWVAVSGDQSLSHTQHGHVFLSTDNGATWNHVYTTETGDWLYSVCARNDYIVAVGEAGILIYSDDRGTTWHIGNSGTTENLHRVRVNEWGRYVAVGDGVVVHNNAAYSQWGVVNITGSPYISGLAFGAKETY